MHRVLIFQGSALFPRGGKSLFILHRAVGLDADDRWYDLHISHIVTTVIINAGLLGLHAKSLATVHNCPHWRVLYIMNMGEEGEA